MDVSWLTLLMLAAVLIATVLLAIVCLDCRNKSPLASISQTAASEEYVPSSGFMVIHPFAGQPRPNQSTIHSPSSLKPQSIPADRGSDRGLRAYTPTETESNASYENPVPGTDLLDSDAEGDPEGDGYIVVLPDPQPSRGSTPSSDPNYVNVDPPQQAEAETDPESDPESDPAYENWEEIQHQPPNGPPAGSTADLSYQSQPEDEDEDDNYVNQPPVGAETHL
ncbi:linker for activation of T-cells family member 1 isoform 2-T2 [Anableps anableps]